MRRTALSLALFLAGFLLTAQGIRSLVPERLKLRWLDSVQQEVDVIFLGSSHVYRQFDPAIFDQQRGVQGRDQRAINMGSLGMGLMEEQHLLERILARRCVSLRWIVIEALPFDVDMQNENDFGLRRIDWHDSTVTWILLRTIWSSDLPWPEKWSLLKRHGEHWWRRSINLARGMSVVEDFFAAPFSTEEQPGLGIHANGYVALDMATASHTSQAMHQRFLAAPQELLQAVQELPTAGDGGPPSDALRATVRCMEAMAKEQGIGLIWWIHPNLERLPGWRQMAAEGDLQHLVAHDDPQLYPDFYRVRWRFDRFHLNRKGSELLTRIFAADFLRLTAPEHEGGGL